MILARADRELRELVGELRDDVAVAKRVGLELEGLIEAAAGAPSGCFGPSATRTSTPGPSTHGALAGAWFHGALCGAVARGWESSLPERLVGAGDLMEAIQPFETESSETGDSRKTLSRYLTQHIIACARRRQRRIAMSAINAKRRRRADARHLPDL